jgi:hypothetical protein
MILVTILISVMIIICKLRGRRGAKSLSTNDDSSCSSGDEEEEDDDNIDDNDQHDLVTISNNTKESIFKPITNKFKKKTKKFAYSHFNQKSNSALSNLIENDSAYSISNNKHLLVQCDRNSIVSSFASSTASTLNNTVSEKNEQTENNNNNNNNKKTIYKQITKSESELSLEDKIKINYNIYN